MNKQPEAKALDSSVVPMESGLPQNDTRGRRQRGVAMIMMLIVLAVGSMLLVPTLSYATTALNAHRISREGVWVKYALDAITQQALWELQYDTEFQDCDPEPSTTESFAECVAINGEWTLTTQALPVGTPHTVVPQVDGQDVSVTVEVPGGLAAPTPTPPALVGEHCLRTEVTRAPTWVQVDEPITYSFYMWNCSVNKNPVLRRIKALLPPTFTYVPGSAIWTSNDVLPPSDLVPEENICDGVADYYPCLINSTPEITDGTVMENWPDGLTNYSNAQRIGPGEDATLTFQAIPSTWGVFYVEAVLCYFAAPSGDPGPCQGDSSNTKRSGKVAPVTVGMFNIKGNGKGNAFGASSKKDNSGAGLISIEDS